MNKSSIEKILTKGSTKQRALLLANHIAEINYGDKGFLTSQEIQAIRNSFNKEHEIETYNRYKRMFDKVQVFLTNLSQYRLSYMEALTRLDKLILLRMGNYNLEDLVNNILDCISNKSERDKAINIAVGFSNPFLERTIKKDKDGYIKVISTDGPLEHLIQELRTKINEEQVNLKTSIQFIKDYITENNFKIKVFWDFIKKIEKWAKDKENKGLSFFSTEAALSCAESEQLKKIIERNVLELDYDKVEIDSEKYQYLRQGYFDE